MKRHIFSFSLTEYSPIWVGGLFFNLTQKTWMGGWRVCKKKSNLGILYGNVLEGPQKTVNCAQTFLSVVLFYSPSQ